MQRYGVEGVARAIVSSFYFRADERLVPKVVWFCLFFPSLRSYIITMYVQNSHSETHTDTLVRVGVCGAASCVMKYIYRFAFLSLSRSVYR